MVKESLAIILIHFQPVLHFYTPSKYQKTSGFLMFSRGTEVEHLVENGLRNVLFLF